MIKILLKRRKECGTYLATLEIKDDDEE
jgi:hypothetical protein